MLRLLTPILKLIFIPCLLLLFVGCNDVPTDIAAELVPGTDTIYAFSSNSSPIMPMQETQLYAVPLVNNSIFLFGKTADSDARLLFELLTYPTLGAPDDYTVLQSDLIMEPLAYIYGDTLVKTLGITGYELQKAWSANSTWDSIWATDGSSVYYSTAQPTVCDFSKDLTSTDSLVYVPFNTDLTKKWLTLGADTATARLNYGIALVTNTPTSIRQFRYLLNAVPTMQLRVITKHKDSVNSDTSYLDPFIASFVNSPPVPNGQLILQGARKFRIAFDIDIDSLPEYSIFLGANFRVYTDDANSTYGNSGPDAQLTLAYNTSDSTRVAISTTGTKDGEFYFSNIITLLQVIRNQGGRGKLYLEADGGNNVWQMNRIRIMDATAPEEKRPRLIISFAIPTVFQ